MNNRIPTIERPRKLIAILGFWFIKKELGKVTTVAKVVYARFPKIMLLVKKMLDIEKKHSLEPQLQVLIQKYVAILNGCTFCMDVSDKKTLELNIPKGKVKDLANPHSSDQFIAAEKSVLKYVEELTKDVAVSDQTFKLLKDHYSDNQVIEITYCAATENFLNRLVKPLGIGSDNLCQINNSGKGL